PARPLLRAAGSPSPALRSIPLAANAAARYIISMTNTPCYVGLDVGGTSMKAGVVDDAGRPLSNVSLPTEAHRGQDFGLERMCEAIRRAVAEAGLTPDRIAAIGVATPGLMDIPAGVILDPPN